MGIRYLIPALGKFTQPDPALSQARLVGANPYAYANCNPTNFADPTGAACDVVGWLGGIATQM
jgi:RHS repeat-associated protein